MNDLRILLLNTKLGNLNAYLTIYVAEGLRCVLGADRVVESDYHTCLNDYVRHGCNAVVCLDGQELHRGLVAKLRRLCGRMVLWLTEDPYEQGTNRRNLDLFDLVFTNDRGSVAFYGSEKVRHLPFAASPTHHFHPVVEREDEYLYDIFFAGTAWPNRVALLRRLTSELARHRFKLVLPHNEFLDPPDLGRPEFEINQRLGNRDLARVQNRSKVVLHLHRDFSASGQTAASTTPGPRVFETALAGAFQLAEDTLPEMDAYFARGDEMACFRTADQCVERIRHYLAHAEERRGIARAAQERVQREHLYSHRAATMIDHLRGWPARSTDAPIAIANRPATVLYVLHNIAGKPPYGGAELHTRDTIESLTGHFKPLVYYPDMVVPHARRMLLRDQGRDRVIELRTAFNPHRFDDPEREQAFAELLEREGVDLVHFMHFLRHPFSLIETARRHGVPTVVTLHDYFAVCPRFNLLDADLRFCWTTKPSLATCDADLARTDRLEEGSQASRRAWVGHALGLADAVTCVSASQWKIVGSVYPHLAERLHIIAPGIQAERFERGERSSHPADRPLEVAIPGNFTLPKGAEALLSVFRAFADDARVRFHVLGQVDEGYAARLAEFDGGRVVLHGGYEPARLPELLKSMDVAILASIWAETYVLTLSECWASGVVPIVSDIGALSERVTHGNDGLKVRPDSSDDIVTALRRIREEAGLLERLRAGGRGARFQTVSSATRAYEALYAELLQTRRDVRLRASESETFAPIGPASRRLHATWARGPGAQMPGMDGPGVVAAPALGSKIMAYYRKHGLAPTAKRLFDRLIGRP